METLLDSVVNRPRVWVTRAPEDAVSWIRGLHDLGLNAQALPLMAIGPAPDPQPVQRAWQRIAQYQAVMFVSANAVRYFFQMTSEAVLTPGAVVWGSSRAWVTGPGSYASLLTAGVPANQIDAPSADAPQFDSEALWAVVAPQAGPTSRVLIVRGCDATGRITGRDWLVTQLQAAGVQVDQVAAYQRQVPVLTQAQRLAAIQGARDGSMWLFSNSEALAHLQAALPQQDWSQAKAVATHPRIAHNLREAGWGVVAIAQPDMAAVASSIKSCHDST
jgi:uroporphyrinogen-III synthase